MTTTSSLTTCALLAAALGMSAACQSTDVQGDPGGWNGRPNNSNYPGSTYRDNSGNPNNSTTPNTSDTSNGNNMPNGSGTGNGTLEHDNGGNSTR